MSASATAATSAEESKIVAPKNPLHYHWQQTMLRIKDPAKTIPFYQDHFGLTLIDKYDFPDYKFSLYFLAVLPKPEEAKELPTPGSEEAHTKLWNTSLVTLELTHNYGTENDPNFKHNNGNVEPNRGFGHIAFLTDDVYKVSEELLQKGVAFQKKPDEGRMKGLAFALDPDGYWIEIIKRGEKHDLKPRYNLAQTMIRVKDPVKSLKFYTEQCKMTLIARKHFPEAKFSLYFLSCLPEDTTLPFNPDSQEAHDYMKNMFHPVLELTHNHGTESDPNFSYHNGNDDPKGYGHIGFLVDDLGKACEELDKAGAKFKKRPEEGKMRGLAFVYDPDNYWVEIIQRGMKV